MPELNLVTALNVPPAELIPESALTELLKKLCPLVA
jgi:hypothetical protein